MSETLRAVEARLSSLAADGHVRRAGVIGGVVVASPLASMIVVVPTIMAMVSGVTDGGVLPLALIAITGVLAGCILVSAAVAGWIWARRAITSPTRMGPLSVVAMSLLAAVTGIATLDAIVVLLEVAVPMQGQMPDVVFLAWSAWPGLLSLIVVIPHVLWWREVMVRVAKGPAPIDELTVPSRPRRAGHLEASP